MVHCMISAPSLSHPGDGCNRRLYSKERSKYNKRAGIDCAIALIAGTERKTINMKKLEEYVRSIPDFPEPGIIFRDVTTILQDADGLALAVDSLTNMVKDKDFDLVVGPESRGFIFGVPVAYLCHKGFVPVRKKGKLPCETITAQYDLEYGTAEIEIHKDAIRPGQKVVIVDDLIATGGTTEAIIRLVQELGGQVVKICFVMELAGLKGRERLKDYEVESAIIYEGK